MSDGSLRTVGTGTTETIATDQITDAGVADGQKAQRVKIGIGPDGSYGDVLPPADTIAGGNVLPAAGLVWDDGSGSWYRARNATTADAAPGLGMSLTHPMIFNGSTFDRERGNVDGTLFASAARTTQVVSADQVNVNHRGVILYLVITAGSSPSLAPIIEAFDPANGDYTYLWDSPTPVTTSAAFYQYALYPGATATPDAGVTIKSYSYPLPRRWRVLMLVGNSNSITYSLGYSLIR